MVNRTLSVAEIVGTMLDEDAPIYIGAFDGSSFGSEDAPLHLVVKSSRAVYYIAQHPNDLGLARAYLQGDIDSPELEPGNPYAVFKQLAELKSHIHAPNPAQLAEIAATLLSHGIRIPKPPAIELPSLARRITEGILPHTHKGDATTVSYHYDQGNEFYALFLGPSMTYTCACFATPDTSLEDAQWHKLNLVLDKLNLKAGDSLLDIGCGWGSMEVAAAKRGIHVIGVTLSDRQVQWGRDWIKREGLGDLAEIRQMDYRDVPEAGFDGICSLGMMEHVGVRHYPLYFREMLNKLRPGGMLLNHQIIRSQPGVARRAGGFIETIINRTGFEVINQENLRQHYELTLQHWNENLQSRWNEAVRMVGEPKARLWGVYMAGSRFNFEINTIQIHQFLCIKPASETGAATYPLRPWWKR